MVYVMLLLNVVHDKYYKSYFKNAVRYNKLIAIIGKYWSVKSRFIKNVYKVIISTNSVKFIIMT